jgi:hypothetical protein
MHLEVLFETSASQKVKQHSVSSAVFEELRQREDTKLLTFLATFKHCTDVSKLYRGHMSSRKYENFVTGWFKVRRSCSFVHTAMTQHMNHNTGRTDERTARLPARFRQLVRNGVNILGSFSVYECARFYDKCTSKHQKQMKNIKHVFH